MVSKTKPSKRKHVDAPASSDSEEEGPREETNTKRVRWGGDVEDAEAADETTDSDEEDQLGKVS